MAWGSIPRTRLETGRAHEFEAGLMPVYSTEMCGDADGAAEVTAERQAAKAGGQRRTTTSRRSAWSSGDVPRIVRCSVDRVVSLPIAEHHRHVRLADYNGARGFNTLDCNGRPRAHRFLELRQAPRAGRTFISECLLDRDRHAMEWPPG